MNFTIFRDGVVLKPWPWIVIVVKGPPCWGVKLKMVTAPGVIVERPICRMLPTGS